MQTTRRTFLKSMGAGAAALAGLPNARAATEKPNMVVVLCDDLGYGDIGCFGSPVIKTPRLDAFAREGMKLTDCYAAAPVCSPSRAGMLTGRTPDRCSVYDWIPENTPMHLRREERTVASLLRDAGYTTCHSGKWHCNGIFNSPEQPQPGDHGFDYWFSTQNNAQPSHKDPVNFVRNGKETGPMEGYSSTIIVNEAMHWIKEERDREKPFCLFVWFHAPHEPIATAPVFMDLYPEAEKKGEREYYGNVSQMDHEFGRLMDTLDEEGLREDTFVFFTSDNGPETRDRYKGAWRSHGSPGPLRGMKLHLYEGGIRVPGIARWPGHIRPDTVSEEPVSGVDMLPTLCAMGGAAVPVDRAIDGASMLPAFSMGEIARETPLYWQYRRALSRPYTVAMRHGEWKILADRDLKQFELYNLRMDMGEDRNLAELRPEQLERMKKMLAPLHRSVVSEGIEWPEKKKG
jgi:arylsulfatase A